MTQDEKKRKRDQSLSLPSGEWTLEIVRSQSRIVEVFHLNAHAFKNHSTFFEGLSIATDASTSKKHCYQQTVRMVLEDRAVDFIAEFFDYLAHHNYGAEFTFTVQNAVAIRNLAYTFQVKRLQEDSWKFIKQTMNIDNVEYYLSEALHANDEQTATWVAFECAKHIAKLDSKSSVLHMLRPNDFKHMISLVQSCRTASSNHASDVVAEYCSRNWKILKYEWFQEITDSVNLPQVSSKAASQLLQVERAFLNDMNHIRPFPEGDDNTVMIRMMLESQSCPSLHRRCLNALKQDQQCY